jgi:hypothetical protein
MAEAENFGASVSDASASDTGLEPKIAREASIKFRRLLSATSVARSRQGIETPLQPPVSREPHETRSSRKVERLMSACSVAQLHSRNSSTGELPILGSSFLRSGSKTIERLSSGTSAAQSKPNAFALAEATKRSSGQDEKSCMEVNISQRNLKTNRGQPEEPTHFSEIETLSTQDTKNMFPCKELYGKAWSHAGTVSDGQDMTYFETDAEASIPQASSHALGQNYLVYPDKSTLVPIEDKESPQVHAEDEMMRKLNAPEAALAPVPGDIATERSTQDANSSHLNPTEHIRPLSSASNPAPTSVGHARMATAKRDCTAEESKYIPETNSDKIHVCRHNSAVADTALLFRTTPHQCATSKATVPEEIDRNIIQETSSALRPNLTERRQANAVAEILGAKDVSLHRNVDATDSLPTAFQMRYISNIPQNKVEGSAIPVLLQKDNPKELSSIELAQEDVKIQLNPHNVAHTDLKQYYLPSDRPRDETNQSYSIFDRVAQLYPTSVALEPKRELQVPSMEISQSANLDQCIDGGSWIAAASSTGSSSSGRRARLLSRDQMLSWVWRDDRKQASEDSSPDDNADFADNLDPTEFSISPSSASRLNFDSDRSPVLAKFLTEACGESRKIALTPDVIVRRPIGTSTSSFGRISSELTESSEHLQDTNHGLVRRESTKCASSSLGRRSLSGSGRTKNPSGRERHISASRTRSGERLRAHSAVIESNIQGGKAVRRNSIGSLLGAEGSLGSSMVGKRDGMQVPHQHAPAGSLSPSRSGHAAQTPDSMHKSEDNARQNSSVQDSNRLSPQRVSKTRLAFGVRGFVSGRGVLSLLAPRSTVLSRAGPDVPEAARTEFTVAYPVAYTADLLATVCQDSLGLRVFRRTSGDKLRVERAEDSGPHMVAAVLLQTERDGVTHVRIRASRSDRGRTTFAALWTFYDDLVTQLEMLAHDTAAAHATRNNNL